MNELIYELMKLYTRRKIKYNLERSQVYFQSNGKVLMFSKLLIEHNSQLFLEFFLFLVEFDNRETWHSELYYSIH